MRRLLSFTLLAVALGAAPALAQDPAAVWTAVNQPVFDGARSTSVSNLVVERDRIKITLASGRLQFAQPVNGRVFAAVFSGSGRIEVQPPNRGEAHQLLVHTGKTSLAMDFSEATFSFTDGWFEEVSGKATMAAGAAGGAEAYRKRQDDREDNGAEIVPRIFKGLLSADAKRTAYFAADVKTDDKGWVLARFDALEPEEVSVGRWTNWGGANLFDTWAQFPAGGVSAAQAFRDPLAREDFKIASYKINATVSTGADLSADTTVNLTHQASGERVLVFEFDSNLRLESVKDKGAALTFYQPRDPRNRNQSYGDYAVVVLPQPTAAGQAQALEFRYAGKRVVRKEGNGNFFCQSYGWYPTRNSSFSTRADFDLTFRSPKRYEMVATGDKISETTDGDWDITVWKSPIPLAVAGFAFGDYKIITEKVGDISVEIYANNEPDNVMREIQTALNPTLPQQMGQGSLGGSAAVGTLTPAKLAKPMATEIGNTLRVFQNYFGPYPYKRLAVSSLPLSYSYGQGWPTLIYLWSLSFLDGQQRHTLGIRDHTDLTDAFRAHESSHQWWGHRVSWKSYHDQWLSEGFAEFSGNLYVQFTKGEKELSSRLRRDRENLRTIGDLKGRRLESLGPIWMGRRLSSADAPSAYSRVIYAKGGYVVNMLRMMLYNNRSQTPDERFIAMMRDFTQTYHNQAASTEDFKAIVEKHMVPAMDVDGNKKMDWFFDQYVYGTGIPEYNFQTNVEALPNNQWKVTGLLTRTGVPETWKDMVPLYVTTGGRTFRIGWLTARGAREEVNLPPLPFKPERIFLNAHEDMLMEVRQ